jgi:hypothetical protein
MDIGLEGHRNLANLINIHFTSVDLAQRLMATPAMLYFVFSSRVVMVLVAHDLRTGAQLKTRIVSAVKSKSSDACQTSHSSNGLYGRLVPS